MIKNSKMSSKSFKNQGETHNGVALRPVDVDVYGHNRNMALDDAVYSRCVCNSRSVEVCADTVYLDAS